MMDKRAKERGAAKTLSSKAAPSRNVSESLEAENKDVLSTQKDHDKDGFSGSQSPDPNCSICLSKLENKSFTDSCFHMFCFVCLLEWSKIKAECPLCKQPFKSIIHNVRSYDDYDQYDIQRQDSSNNRRFRYRTTLTFDRLLALQQQEHQWQLNLLQRPSAFTRRYRWRHSQIHGATTDFRRNIYQNNLRVATTMGRNGRYRDISPEFFRTNTACTHRLVPWLNRELNALLQNQGEHVQFVMELILDLIKRYAISSEEFYQHICPFVGRHTRHFMHEFQHYAQSPYHDMMSYDNHTTYHPYTEPVDSDSASVSSESNNSDVVIISPEIDSQRDHRHSVSQRSSDSLQKNEKTEVASNWDQDTTPRDTEASGWESPTPGPSGIFATIVDSIPPLEVSEESKPTADRSAKSENSKRQHSESSSNESADSDSDSTDSSDDVIVTGYEKPWAERTPILISDSEEALEPSSTKTEKSPASYSACHSSSGSKQSSFFEKQSDYRNASNHFHKNNKSRRDCSPTSHSEHSYKSSKSCSGKPFRSRSKTKSHRHGSKSNHCHSPDVSFEGMYYEMYHSRSQVSEKTLRHGPEKQLLKSGSCSRKHQGDSGRDVYQHQPTHSQGRSRSSSVEIIACKKKHKQHHKKHKKHKHKKHHHKHSKKPAPETLDAAKASVEIDISSPSLEIHQQAVYKKHPSGHKKSRRKQAFSSELEEDIQVVHGESSGNSAAESCKSLENTSKPIQTLVMGTEDSDDLAIPQTSSDFDTKISSIPKLFQPHLSVETISDQITTHLSEGSSKLARCSQPFSQTLLEQSRANTERDSPAILAHSSKVEVRTTQELPTLLGHSAADIQLISPVLPTLFDCSNDSIEQDLPTTTVTWSTVRPQLTPSSLSSKHFDNSTSQPFCDLSEQSSSSCTNIKPISLDLFEQQPNTSHMQDGRQSTEIEVMDLNSEDSQIDVTGFEEHFSKKTELVDNYFPSGSSCEKSETFIDVVGDDSFADVTHQLNQLRNAISMKNENFVVADANADHSKHQLSPLSEKSSILHTSVSYLYAKENSVVKKNIRKKDKNTDTASCSAPDIACSFVENKDTVDDTDANENNIKLSELKKYGKRETGSNQQTDDIYNSSNNVVCADSVQDSNSFKLSARPEDLCLLSPNHADDLCNKTPNPAESCSGLSNRNYTSCSDSSNQLDTLSLESSDHAGTLVLSSSKQVDSLGVVFSHQSSVPGQAVSLDAGLSSHSGILSDGSSNQGNASTADLANHGSILDTDSSDQGNMSNIESSNQGGGLDSDSSSESELLFT